MRTLPRAARPALTLHRAELAPSRPSAAGAAGCPTCRVLEGMGPWPGAGEDAHDYCDRHAPPASTPVTARALERGHYEVPCAPHGWRSFVAVDGRGAAVVRVEIVAHPRLDEAAIDALLWSQLNIVDPIALPAREPPTLTLIDGGAQ